MAEKRAGKIGGSKNAEVKQASSNTNINNGREKSSNNKPESQEPLKTLTSFLTVEPLMVIQMATAILAFMAVQDFLLVKGCRVNYGYSEEVCSALKNGEEEKYPEEQANIQKLAGSVLMWRAMLENLFPMALVCLIGPWSDKYGRKTPMLLVMGSFIIQHLLLILCALDTSIIGANSVGIISSLIVSLTGNNACFMMCTFSYVSDTTPKDKLTGKTGITGCSIFLGVTVGMGLSGALSSLGFVKIFAIAAIGETIGFLWLLYGLPNVLRDEKAVAKVSTKQMFVELFDKQHLFDAIGSGFKARPGNDRMKLLALLASHCLVTAPMMGEGAVLYLFGKYKFGWDAAAFASFMTFKMVGGFIGNFVSMIVLGNKLKLSDAGIGIVSCVSHILSCFVFAFASSSSLMYFGPIVALFSGQIMSVARSIIFKTVSSSETGKINALMGSLDSLTPLLATPVYSFVYASTFEYMPGALFLLSAAFVVPPIVVYWVLLNTKTKAQ